MTAKKTANVTTKTERWRTLTDSQAGPAISGVPCWIAADASPAVFKTVCGALLRRPGWVRFPSIPAKSGVDYSQDDSQVDSHSSDYLVQ
jgi:hypothetical protein